MQPSARRVEECPEPSSFRAQPGGSDFATEDLP